MDLQDDDQDVRAIPTPLYAILYLPGGASTGFVTIMLGYILTHNGVSVAAVAGVVSLAILPTSLKFALGPLLDMSLTSRIWHAIMTGLGVLTAMGFAFTAFGPHDLPVICGLSLLIGISNVGTGSSATAAMAATTLNEVRGRIAGWTTVGSLGGIGIGGGVCLWIAQHAGGPKAGALVLAACYLVCAIPALWLRPPRRTKHDTVRARLAELGLILWRLLRTRRGVFVLLAMTLPCGLGAAFNLLPAVAGDWRASADLVAAVTGVLGGLAVLPGSVIGGYLCDKLPRRTVYACSSLVFALGEAAMAGALHTPVNFAAFVLLNNFLLGIVWAAVAAVEFDCLGQRGAATLSTVLSSLANLPVVGVTALLGLVQVRGGSTVMLLTEAGLGMASVAFFGGLAWFWKPNVAVAPAKALAAA